MRILAADIGGTSSRFAWFEVVDREPVLGDQHWFPTAESLSFTHLADQAVEAGFDAARADLAVLAVPGAVVGGTFCDPPNIPWTIDLAAHGGPFSEAAMINDFTAQAWATATKPGREAVLIQEGEAREGAGVAVIGAGTGLGHGALVPTAHGWAPVISENGHTAFPFVGEEEREFARFARARVDTPYLDLEDVVSGSGLALLHKFHTGEKLDAAGAASRLGPESPVLQWFSRFYGRVARHWTLAVLALGGLWISGGVAARNPLLVGHPAFLEEFTLSLDYHDLLSRVPVRLMDSQEAGLYGAARYGLLSLEGAL